jgi:hypothetical protein
LFAASNQNPQILDFNDWNRALVPLPQILFRHYANGTTSAGYGYVCPKLSKLKFLMVNSVNEKSKIIDQVEAFFVEAENRWVGCDWDTDFGPLKLDLNRLTAERATVLANATSGQESQAWNDAADWLAKVESDAAEAKLLATQAVAHCRKRMWQLALSTMEYACTIESAYHSELTWQPLRDLIASAIVTQKSIG